MRPITLRRRRDLAARRTFLVHVRPITSHGDDEVVLAIAASLPATAGELAEFVAESRYGGMFEAVHVRRAWLPVRADAAA